MDGVLDYTLLKSYFEVGYVVGRDVVPRELVCNALKVANYWTHKHMFTAADGNSTQHAQQHQQHNGMSSYSQDGVLRGKHNTVELTGSVTSDMDILAVYYATPLAHIVQRLLGAGDVANPTTARIITTYPTLELTESPALYGNKWTVEGFTSTGGHSPYTLLLGVALTDIADTNMGNFCVHPGSHMSLLEEYIAQVRLKNQFVNKNK